MRGIINAFRQLSERKPTTTCYVVGNKSYTKNPPIRYNEYIHTYCRRMVRHMVIQTSSLEHGKFDVPVAYSALSKMQ